MTETPNPSHIALVTEPAGLEISWSDDSKQTLSFTQLRRACPCALCAGEGPPIAFSEREELPVVQNLPPQAFEAKNLFKIGNYALGILWGDGHDDGIYTYEYLRGLTD